MSMNYSSTARIKVNDLGSLAIKFKFLILVSCLTVVTLPLRVLAHQPRIVDAENITVSSPEISKAYYGRLSGKPHIYFINANYDINLYVNVLVPFIEGPGKNITARIFKEDLPLGKLNPGKEDWKRFFEPFGQSMYWQGPEYKVRANAGKYKIIVQSIEKNIRYVLAIGEIEAFDGIESLKAILLIPQLKKSYFEESPISFIYSPLGWGYILLLQLLVMLVGWSISRTLNIIGIKILKNFFQKFSKINMILGLIFWVGFLGFAVKTSWHPILIILSGFALFIAITSWHTNYRVDLKT